MLVIQVNFIRLSKGGQGKTAKKSSKIDGNDAH